MTGTIEAIEIRRLLRDDWEEGTHGAKTHGEKSGISWKARRYGEAGPVLWEKPGALGRADSDAATAILLQGDAAVAQLEAGVDVLSHVQAWHRDRKTAMGLLIRTTNTKICLCRWASSDAPGAAGPVLRITYATPQAG